MWKLNHRQIFFLLLFSFPLLWFGLIIKRMNIFLMLSEIKVIVRWMWNGLVNGEEIERIWWWEDLFYVRGDYGLFWNIRQHWVTNFWMFLVLKCIYECCDAVDNVLMLSGMFSAVFGMFWTIFGYSVKEVIVEVRDIA